MDAQTKEIIEYCLRALPSMALAATPIVVLVLALIFKKDIRALLARIKAGKIGTVALELEGTPQVAQTLEKATAPPVASPTTDATPAPAGSVTSLGPPPIPGPPQGIAGLLDEVTTNILTNPPMNQLVGKDRETFLARFLAERIISLSFERTYRVIFGSQMEALLLINNPGGAAHDGLMNIFNNAKQRWPQIHAKRTFDQWIQFMLDERLIEAVGDHVLEVNPKYRILPFGKGFLHYARRGVTGEVQRVRLGPVPDLAEVFWHGVFPHQHWASRRSSTVGFTYSTGMPSAPIRYTSNPPDEKNTYRKPSLDSIRFRGNLVGTTRRQRF